MLIWRYGILSDKCDLTDLDQWIGKASMKRDAPKAPEALRIALENFIENHSKPCPVCGEKNCELKNNLLHKNYG